MESNKLRINIKIVGVGGGGGNMLSYFFKNYLEDKLDIEGLETIAMNTDAQVLQSLHTDIKTIQLGPKICDGMGAGMKPEVAAESVLESEEVIKQELEGADLVFLATGLGGGTGSGAIAPIAQICQDIGAMSVAVVTTPFSFEARKRSRIAKDSLENLKKSVNSLITIDNNKIAETAPEEIGMKDAFNLADEVLAKAINGILNIVLSSGEDSINIDFADLKTALNNTGQALISTGYGKGDKAAVEAVDKALTNPLLNTTDIYGCKGMIINWTIHPKFSFKAINAATDTIYDKAGEETDLEIIFGITYNEELDEDEVHVTLLATGFQDQEKIAASAKNDLNASLRNEDRISEHIFGNVNAEILNVPDQKNSQPLKIRIDETVTTNKKEVKNDYDLFSSFRKKREE